MWPFKNKARHPFGPLGDLAPKGYFPDDCAPGTPGSAVPPMPDRETDEIAHRARVNEARRAQEIAEAEHQARMAVLRWRREHPGFAATLAAEEPYPGYGPHPRHGRTVMPPPAPAAPSRNPIPQPDPERRSRPRGDRTSNQVPPYPLPPSPEPYRLNTARDVAVATDTYWNEDMTTCPRGAKVQLLGAGGVAVYGNYHGDPFWECWAPVPRRRPR